MKVYPKAGLALCLAMLCALPAFASQNVADVIRMTKNGTTADVLVAFIEKSNDDPRLTADDIVLMEDASVPAAAIEAMLSKEKAALAGPGAGTAPAEDVTVAPAADNADISYFYDSMSRDGSWTNDAEYGWIWSPTISAGDPNWRPYVDNGSWVYTDNGWYWNSGYNWGWAAFHYGRWSHRNDRWSWHPDNVWGSSWVSWRNNDDYYGWAPLTPRARFGSHGGFDVGITTGNFDVNIGLHERDYAFVRSNQFFDRDLNRHQIRGNEVNNIYKTTTITNTYTSHNNRHINQGIPVQNVSRATKQEVKAVTLVDNSAKAGEPVRVGAMQNNRLEVFRPTLAAKASVDPNAAVARRTEARAKHLAAKPPVVGETAKPDAAAERQATRKAEAVKRVSERAAKEPPVLRSKATEAPRRETIETPRREAVDPKAPAAPKGVPEAKPEVKPEIKAPPVERTPARVPERREQPRAETPKAREDAPKKLEPVKQEPEARRERADKPEKQGQPEKQDPKAREEQPNKAEKPGRPEKSEKSEKSEKPDRNEK